MPSKPSVTRRPRIDAGTRNVVRYHHGFANGEVESIGRCTKFLPMSYVIPGSLRMFIPKNGSGYRCASTMAPTMVEGTVVPCQRRVKARYAGDEIFAPSLPTLSDEAIIQPVRSICRFCADAKEAKR